MFRDTYKLQKLEKNSVHSYYFATIRKFYNLNEVCKNMTSEQNRVWACDTEKVG